MEISNRSDNTSIQPTPLEVFVPEKIIENLKEKEDCTQDLVEMITSTHQTQLKKLAFVFFSLENYEMEKIIELTASKTRFHRYNSTFLIFSWIKNKFLDLKKLSEVEAVYETVFVPRFRDIDPSIRAMCVQFFCDWAVASKTLRQISYLKYLGWALNDRNDSVRRKAIKGIFRVFRASKKDDSENLVTFIEKYKSRLLEMSLKDINLNLQKEGCRTVLYLYLKNQHLFSTNEIVTVISSGSDVSDIKILILKKLLPDGIWDLDALHTLLVDSNPSVFKNLKLNIEDTNAFIINLIEFIKNRSTCCSAESICLLKIIKELKVSIDPIIFIDLINIVRNNPLNVKIVIDSLSSVVSFSEYPSSTFQVLDYLYKLVNESINLNSNFFIQEFIILLKNLEDSFSIQVNQIINDLKSKFPLLFVRFFDISDFIDNTHSPLVKCYAALWKIMREEYEWVNSLTFDSLIISNDEKTCNGSITRTEYLELVDFLVFLIKKIPFNISTTVENASSDPLSCGKLLFDKLSAFVSTNFLFDDEYSCLFLFKLISLGYFTCFSKILFKFCSEETLKSLLPQIKDSKILLIGYFEYLEEAKSNFHPSISKILASKVMRTDTDRFIFSNLKRLVSKTELIDNVLINFVPCLNVSECIVLENLISKGKMKSLLLKKCKSIRNIENNENITFI